MNIKESLKSFFSPANRIRPKVLLVILLLLAGWSAYFISVNADNFISQANNGISAREPILTQGAEQIAEDLGISSQDSKVTRKALTSSPTSDSSNNGTTTSDDSQSGSGDDSQPTEENPETISSYIAFYADNQSDSDEDDTRHINVVNRILASGANPVIHAGDIMEDGTEDSWNRFLNVAGTLLSTRTFYAALGNNDRVVGDSSTPSPYFLNYFNFPNNERWYSVNSGNLHIVVLDSAFAWGNTTQLAWLASDLQSADSQSRITVVVYHHPTFISTIDSHLINYGADFVVAGHIHSYSKTLSNGIYYFTLPGGTSLGHATASIYNTYGLFRVFDSGGNLIESTQFNER